MRVSSPIPHKKARIEIIPLIDIMFFLLASFMMSIKGMISIRAFLCGMGELTRMGKFLD